jgi:hypothetical protein
MGTRGGLLRPRKFEQSSGQVTLNRIEVTISLNSAVELTAKNAKKDSYEWIA